MTLQENCVIMRHQLGMSFDILEHLSYSMLIPYSFPCFCNFFFLYPVQFFTLRVHRAFNSPYVLHLQKNNSFRRSTSIGNFVRVFIGRDYSPF